MQTIIILELFKFTLKAVRLDQIKFYCFNSLPPQKILFQNLFTSGKGMQTAWLPGKLDMSKDVLELHKFE